MIKCVGLVERDCDGEDGVLVRVMVKMRALVSVMVLKCVLNLMARRWTKRKMVIVLV